MRAVSTSVMAALVTIALFWGNCFSCPQVLLAFTSHQAHSCCHKTKAAGCETQNLQQFVKASPTAPPPALPAIAVVLQPPAPALLESLAAAEDQYSPPNLLALHSAFRI